MMNSADKRDDEARDMLASLKAFRLEQEKKQSLKKIKLSFL